MPEVYRGLEPPFCQCTAPRTVQAAPRGTDSRGTDSRGIGATDANRGCGSRRTGIQPAALVGLEAGWLIAKKPDAADAETIDASPRCLQLATGQWCLPNWATWFPSPGPAVVYASDRGYRIGQSVEIIYLRRDRQNATGSFLQS